MLKSVAFKKAKQRNYKILLVENKLQVIDLICKIIENKAYQITTAISTEAAIEALNKNDFDLLIVDLAIIQISGTSFLEKAKELNPETNVIITTGNIEVIFAIENLRYIVDDYLLKPFKLDNLSDCVAHYYKHSLL